MPGSSWQCKMWESGPWGCLAGIAEHPLHGGTTKQTLSTWIGAVLHELWQFRTTSIPAIGMQQELP